MRCLILLFVLVPLSVVFSAYADDECWTLPSPAKPNCNCSQSKNQIDDSKSFTNELLSKVTSDPKARSEIEGEFFWNFLRDQTAQTACESNMLTTMDILPGRGLCPEQAKKLSLKESIELVGKNIEESPNLRASKQGTQIQKAILQSVWRNLPDLATNDLACSQATQRLKNLSTRSNSSSFGNHGETVATMSGAYDVRIEEQSKLAAEKCALRDAVFNRIWSGSAPEMQGFVKKWINRYNSDKRLQNDKNGDAFLKEVLPVQANGRLANGGDIDWSKTFQGSVLTPMFCEAKKRQNILKSHMKSDGTTPRDGTFTKGDPTVGQDLKKILLKDGGKAALAYMNRVDKYRAVGSQLQCHIEKEYYTIPNRQATARMIVVGGITLVVTAGAAAGVEGMGIIGLVVDGTIAAAATHEAIKTCGESMYALGSLQTQPICELFNGPQGQIVSNVTQKLQARECNEAVIEALIAGAGVGLVGAEMAMNAAYLVGEGAAPSFLKALKMGSSPAREKVNEEILRSVVSAQGKGQNAFQLIKNPDLEGAVLSRLRGPGEVEAINRAALERPKDFQALVDKYRTVCGKAASNKYLTPPPVIFNLFQNTAEAADFGCSLWEVSQFENELRRFAGLDSSKMRTGDWVTVRRSDGTMSNAKITQFNDQTGDAVVQVYSSDGRVAGYKEVPWWDLGHPYEGSYDKIPVEAYRTKAPGTAVSYDSLSGNRYPGFYVAETDDLVFIKPTSDSSVQALRKERLVGSNRAPVVQRPQYLAPNINQSRSVAVEKGLDKPQYFVRDTADKISDPNYIKNATESIDNFDSFWRSTSKMSGSDLEKSTKDMHVVAGLGKEHNRPYGGAAKNHNIRYGEFHSSGQLSNGRPSDVYANQISQQYRLGPVIEEGKVPLPGIPKDAQPTNMYGRHFYPDSKYVHVYFEQGAHVLNDLKSMPKGSERAMNAIADYYQLMANARPFDNINNSLFMSQTNYLLKEYGFNPMTHGFLDHLSMRLTPEQFRKAFKIHNQQGLPPPPASIKDGLTRNDIYEHSSPFLLTGAESAFGLLATSIFDTPENAFAGFANRRNAGLDHQPFVA